MHSPGTYLSGSSLQQNFFLLLLISLSSFHVFLDKVYDLYILRQFVIQFSETISYAYYVNPRHS